MNQHDPDDITRCPDCLRFVHSSRLIGGHDCPTDLESEHHSALQDRAEELLPDEMKSLFRDPASVREAITEMSDAEIKSLLEIALVWRACERYFKPIARKAALKRAEDAESG